MEPLAISINDTAKALGIGRSSVYTLLKSGRLDAKDRQANPADHRLHQALGAIPTNRLTRRRSTAPA